MEANDKEIVFKKPERLITDDYYYKYVFKKTEKIVCAVFYIVHTDLKDKDNTVLIKDTEVTALEILCLASESLRKDLAEAEEVSETLVFDLLALESKLRALHAAQMLQTEHLNVFISEIDALVRSARSFKHKKNTPVLLARRSVKASQKSPAQKKKQTTSKTVSKETKEQRTEKILNVLKKNPGASIKDIQAVVTDTSDKTIQRELNALIRDGVVKREGSKRWSKYTVA